MRSFDTAYEGSQCNTCLQNIMKSDSLKNIMHIGPIHTLLLHNITFLYIRQSYNL